MSTAVVRIRFALVLPLLCWGIEHSAAQTLPFHSYATRDGLPSTQINALLQDSNGFLWIGTNSGLSVYDGAEFRNYSLADGLTNGWVTSLCESRTGTLWIGTIAGGVCSFSGERFHAIPLGHAEGDHIIGSLVEDSGGTLWCSTNGGVYALSGDSALFIAPPEDRNFGSEILEGPDSIIWVGGGNIVRLYSRPGVLRSTFHIAHAGISITAMTRTADGSVWIGTSDSVISRLQDTVIVGRRRLPGIPFSLREDRRHDLWVRTLHAVVRVATHGASTPREYAVDDIAPGDWVGPILIDREDNLWIGTWLHGLLKISEKNSYTLSCKDVVTAFVDSSRHLWIRTPTGFMETVMSPGGGWKTFRRQFPGSSGNADLWPMSSNAIDARPVDRFGNLWMETGDGSSVRGYISGTSGRLAERYVFRRGVDFPSYPFSFCVDRSSRLWLGLDSGVVEVLDLASGRRVRRFSPADGVPASSIRVMLLDDRNTLWVGSFDRGIAVMDLNDRKAQRFVPLASADNLVDSRIRALFQDRDGAVWIGTRHGGVARYAEGTFRTVSMRDGLISNSIWDIFDDNRGRLWMHTDGGAECIDRRTLKVLSSRDLEGERLLSMGNGGDQFLYLSSSSRITVFESPDELAPDVLPLVHIVGFDVGGRNELATTDKAFAYERNSCTVRFVGTTFRDERKTRYRYRMVGFDTAWSRLTPQRAVTYAALSPGRYTFEVDAVSSDGLESGHPATVTFSIIPPLWKQSWFLVTVIVLSGVLLYGLFRYRLYYLVKMERLRLRIASDLHDDVGTNLSSVLLASQIIESQLPAGSEPRSLLSEVRNRITATQEMLKDIVWLLHPANESIDDFVMKLREVARRQLGNVRCDFQSRHEPARLSLDMKRNLVLLLKEAVTNIAKHADASLAIVEFRIHQNLLSLMIRDDGKGFDASIPTAGNGLANLRMRAGQIGGTLAIQSMPGEGTTITLVAQIANIRNGAKYNRIID